MRTRLAFAACLISAGLGVAPAEVLDSAPSGFTVKSTVAIQAPPDAVYGAFLRHIGEWWDSVHTFSGDARNLSIEEKPMGCFCEQLPQQGAARHMEILRLAPGKTMVLSGALGPMQTMAAAATLTIQLSAAAGGTALEATYAVAGYSPAGLNTLAPAVDQVLNQQFARLKEYVEHGKLAAGGAAR
ncbi:MAG TPA: SRPBCC domain-containing protein [Bryobacteraceae bacterium]|nr:SRPBCC domain-containing protein [Bryobacteraceae bacterium]